MKTLLTAALTAHLFDDIEPVSPKVWREIEPLVAQDALPEEIVEFADSRLDDLSISLIRELLDRMEEASDVLSALAESGISALSAFDEEYPNAWRARLGGRSPALIFAAGNLSLLNGKSFGIVGSRDVDDAGTEFAERAARGAAERDLAVCSGGARGVDQAAMIAAYEAGGAVVGILSDSLIKAARSEWGLRTLDSGRGVLASAVAPGAGFSVGGAMARNKLIYAHASGTLVISCAEGSGGTWTGAVEALRLSLGPVLVRTEQGSPDANRKLIKLGGVAVETPTAIWDALESKGGRQGSLF